MLKRLFDIVFSLIGLIVLFPFFLAIAVLIKLDSRGPVFFRQVRIGRNGRPFQMLKFRTMVEAKHWAGPPLSPRNDPRVTRFGSVLRRFKINEFPQLINVLKGEMSFVGPRPEVPELVKVYTPEQARILSVRPGIVGPSQINMRNEEELYPEGVHPKEYYIEHIMPRKLEIDLEYIESRSLLKDLIFVLQGIIITITGAITKRHLFENAEQIALFIFDTVLCGVAYFAAYYLRMEGTFPAIEKTILLGTMPYVVIVRMLGLTYFGLYGSLVGYFSFDEVIKIVKAVTVSSIVIVILTFFIGHRPHPRSVFVIDWFIVIGLLAGYRVAFKVLIDYVSQGKNEFNTNILIYGVGNIGELALRYLRMRGNGKMVGFIDDDPKKMRKTFQGLKVLGTRYDIETLSRLYDIEHVVIARNKMLPEDLEQIKSLCEEANVTYEVFTLAN